MALTMAEVARDYETDGVPSSGSHKIKKGDMRNWGAWVEGLINALSVGGETLIYSNRGALFADLNHAAHTMAWVLGDPVAAYNGIYEKLNSPGTGSWSRLGDLPYSFIIASDVGAGTANAIQATTNIPVSGSALVWLNIFEANTSSPVTVAFNGDVPLTIKTNAGNNVAVGGLTAGMIVLGIVSGATFRLLSDQSSAAVLAACEAAQAAAEAAAATLPKVLDVYAYVPQPLHAGIKNGTNATDLAPYLQDFFDDCAAQNLPGRWSAGHWLIDSAITITDAVQIECDGYFAGPAPDEGTWIIINSTGFTPITFSGASTRGSRIYGGIAVWQDHAAAGVGWSPTNYDYVFRVVDTLGEVIIDDIYLCGVNKGIYAYNAGRVIVGTIRGQWFKCALELDEIHDVSRLNQMHGWVYYSTHNSVVQYMQANADCIILRRADIPFLGQLFCYGYRSLVRCANGATGTANKVEITTLMADFSKHGLLIDGDADNVTVDVSIYQVQQEQYPQSGLGGIVGSNALQIEGDHARVSIAVFRSEVTGQSAIRMLGVNGRVDIANMRAASWNEDEDGSACFHLANVASGTVNRVYIANTPFLERSGTQPIKNGSTNGVVYRNGAGQTGLLEGIWSEHDVGNSRLIQRPDGIAAVISHAIASKGTGSDVRLMPEGYNVLRADKTSDANSSVLVRAALNVLRLWAEGAGTNIDINLVPKGGGAVVIDGLRSFANDAAAAAASPPVSINGVYRNSSTGALQARIA